MSLLLKNGKILNVFTESLENGDVLIQNDRIIGVGQFDESCADEVVDLEGRVIAPGFIDGHIHIESTMLTPPEFAKAVLPHGTVRIIADPHEIANVCGIDGIRFMLDVSKKLPFHVNVMLPSCVPATPFDESGAVLEAEDLLPLYNEKDVLGLAEVMNYPGVLANDKKLLKKISDAKERGLCVDGHAPLLSGKNLDKYISAGINSDHEVSNLDEAMEKLKKGLWIMIREGSSAKNLESLLPLFEHPYCSRACLVTDDRHCADLISEGHIDNIVRKAVRSGKNPVIACKMASFNAAQCFNIAGTGAIAPSYKADLIVFDSFIDVKIKDVYVDGKLAVKNGQIYNFPEIETDSEYVKKVYDTVHLENVSKKDFMIESEQVKSKCRVIKVIKGQLLTEEQIMELDFSSNNGIDLKNDVLKIAVIERHHNTGHKGLGFIHGMNLKKGALASTVSHDSHNLIVAGTNEEDMAVAANEAIRIGGGLIYACDGKVVETLPLPVAGLMSGKSASETAVLNEKLRKKLYESGVPKELEPFMNMAFISLPVIPHIKMTVHGLIDVDSQKLVSLFVQN